MDYETICIGSNPDGSQRVKGYGRAKTKAEAIEMAKKNALKDVIFKGIRGGSQGCEVKPVIFDPNMQETRSDYFNKFFGTGGDYAKFVSAETKDIPANEIKQAGADITIGVVMTVNRATLKQKFIDDKLLNP